MRKMHNSLRDDDGVEWEFRYDERTPYTRADDGSIVAGPTTVHGFRYRRKDEPEWLSLPPWADVAEDWKINLCLFDQDEETDEYTFWPVTSAERGEEVTA